MPAADLIVMVLYGAVVLGIGFWANRRQKNSEDYFLGGRKLKWWAVGISLVATSFSSASLIGGTGYGYAKGLGWFQLQIGDLIAVFVVGALFLPFFAAQPITTAYEWLEKRFGRRARVVGSVLFLAQTAVRASVLVYGPALAVQAVLGWSVESSILLSATAAIVYSAFGGIAAVVWTDCLQFGVILLAVVATLVVVAGDVPGGFETIMEYAGKHDHLEVVTLEANPKTPMNLLGATVPYLFLAIAIFGTSQTSVQRYLSCTDLKSARRALITGWAAGAIALGTTLLLGVAIFSWHKLAPQAAEFSLEKGDQVLPQFLVTRMPAGLAGLMLAAIFAASMSSLDSAVHSMSTSFLVDIVRRSDLRVARIGTIVIGVIATFGALYAARGNESLLEKMVRWLGYFAGPMLGLFLLGMLTRVRENAALIGVAAGGVLVIILAQQELPVHPLWLCPISTVATCLTALVAARLRRA